MAKQATLEDVVNLYAEGGSDVEVATLLGLSEKKFYELVEENPKFAEVVERGRTMSQSWWYRMGRQGLFADKFNSGLYNFQMKNRYGWADKVETGDKGASMAINADEAKAQLTKLLGTIKKHNPEMLRLAMDDKDD